MKILGQILLAIVAVLHVYFLYLEMFLWTKPKGIKTFGLKSKEFAEETKVLAANQGLYNGFLAAGLFYGLFTDHLKFQIFFLICVTIAGIYGTYSTGKRKLFLIQSVPAVICVTAILLNHYF